MKMKLRYNKIRYDNKKKNLLLLVNDFYLKVIIINSN